jgi:hypothetical protein
MQENELTVAITVRVSAGTPRALQRLAQREHRSLAGQAAYLLEQALAVEPRVRRAMSAERAEHWVWKAQGLGGGDSVDLPATEEDEAGGAGNPGHS